MNQMSLFEIEAKAISNKKRRKIIYSYDNYKLGCGNDKVYLSTNLHKKPNIHLISFPKQIKSLLLGFEIIKPIELKQEVKPIFQPNYDNSDLELDKIKSLLNADRTRDILTSLGYEVDRNFKFKYRQEERTPSASIRHDGFIKDFGSDLSTDAIGFVQEVKNIGFKEAVEYVKLYV